MTPGMVRTVLAVLPGMLLAACGSSPAPRYYALEAPVGTVVAAAAPGQEALSVWVAPVTLPESVDRPQLVLRVSPNRLAILDGHRWVEPLGSAVTRAIAANLAARLGARVSAEGQHAAAGAQVRVLVDVLRFESTAGESVTLEAQWTVRRIQDSTPRHGRARIVQPVSGADNESLVAAHSRAISALSQDIAQAIVGLR